jgi:hypothetical protein
MTNPNKPEIVRPLTFEEMTESQRALYDPSAPDKLENQCIAEYDPFAMFEKEIPSFHRAKR